MRSILFRFASSGELVAVRGELQRSLLAEAVARSGGEPTVCALRGNTPVGKTSTATKSILVLAEALKKSRNGSVNPDIFKRRLRTHGNARLGSAAVHGESCVLADRLVETLHGLRTSDGAPACISGVFTKTHKCFDKTMHL